VARRYGKNGVFPTGCVEDGNANGTGGIRAFPRASASNTASNSDGCAHYVAIAYDPYCNPGSAPSFGASSTTYAAFTGCASGDAPGN
jgi:hypothetical protein